MKILGIETSCDETAAGVVEVSGKGRGRILSNVVSSQVALHRQYRGIVPELASRAHLQKIAGVVAAALEEAGIEKADAVAFTRGPGLMGPLLVGKVAAQTLADFWRKPLIGINHLEGHIFAGELSPEAQVGPLDFPLLALVVSGGHTDMVLAARPGRYRVLGRTRDDAAGEAFDKVARMLDLGYPGGPVIDKLSRQGDPSWIAFPRPRLEGSWDFSFSGLKTSVLYHLRDKGVPKGKDLFSLCASFQEAVADTLVGKLIDAAARFKAKSLVVGGGVAANGRLREKIAAAAKARGLRLRIPPPGLCTDNGVMIAQVAARRLERGVSARGRPGRPDPSLEFKNWG